MQTSTSFAIIFTCLASAAGFAQSPSKPLRTVPVEKLTVKLGFRDWGPSTVAGTTILAGNQTNRGGLFAIDMVSGKLLWSHRPVFSTGTASVSTPPGVFDNIVITPYAAAHPGAVIAVALATGKELWRGPDPAQGAAVAVNAGLAYILAKNGNFYALEAATGREKWKVAFATNRAVCASRPIIYEGTIYLTGSADATVGDITMPSGYYLFALDAKTGQERWRYRAQAPYVHNGVCVQQPVVTADTIFATGESHLFAVNRITGLDRWKPIEIRRPVEGKDRAADLLSLIDAGAALIGQTSGFLIAFDKASGRTVWEIAGQFSGRSASTAVVGNVLYFVGNLQHAATKAPSEIHALDLDSHKILWSFSRQTSDPKWSFGYLTPVDGGLLVDTYEALIKLQ